MKQLIDAFWRPKRLGLGACLLGFLAIIPLFTSSQSVLSQSGWPAHIFSPAGYTATGEVADRMRINIPYTSTANPDAFYRIPDIGLAAITWFGQVTPTTNYTDVRLIYNDTTLYVYFNVFDKFLWYQNTDAAHLTQWDAAILYINQNGPSGALSEQSYAFVGELAPNDWVGNDRTPYQASWRGTGGNWAPAGVPFSTSSHYRGFAGPNSGQESRGWWVAFEIPFSSLGLSQKPMAGSEWGVSLRIADRDSDVAPALAEQTWPPDHDINSPSTWGALRFGLPAYAAPTTDVTNTYTIRAENGNGVSDAEVGGHSDCGGAEQHPGLTPEPGKPLPNFFQDWGNRQYIGLDQVNIQNQIDVADWPCYSKFYLQFPLGNLPAGKQVVGATLTLSQFGNGGLGYNVHPLSFIQVLALRTAWDANNITWNNAPLPWENISHNTVESVPPESNYYANPPLARVLDVSRAVAQVYVSGQPLNLALYSADAPTHSGKYFYTAESLDANYRPTLTITLGDAVVLGQHLYLPLLLK